MHPHTHKHVPFLPQEAISERGSALKSLNIPLFAHISRMCTASAKSAHQARELASENFSSFSIMKNLIGP